MEERKHAILSPSASKMWLECPPSVRLSQDIPDRESIFAEEGTEAHELCEYMLKRMLDLDAEDPRGHLQYYTREMEDCAIEYASYVHGIYLDELEANRNPIVMVEQRLDISDFVPECFGTADSVIISRGRLYVVDFKFGMGVKVESEGNTQMRIYALGALETFSSLCEVEDVVMTIFQPRIGNVSTSSMKADDLYRWADEYLKPRAALAFAGEGEQNSGPWCRFCRVKASCRKRAEENISLACLEFRKPELLSDDEIGEVLSRSEELVAWANDVKGYTIQRLLGGYSIPGFKLVEGRSVRRYTDETAAAEAVKTAGYDPYEHKVLGITAMTSLLGKKQFNEILGAFIVKPHGKPTVVPESDSRPGISADELNDFNEFKEINE